MLKDIEEFLKTFPDKWLLTLIVIYVLVTYQTSHDTYFQRLGDTLIGGLLTLLIGKRGFSDGATNVENLNADSVTVGSSETPADAPAEPEIETNGN